MIKLLNAGAMIIALSLLSSCMNNTMILPPEPIAEPPKQVVEIDPTPPPLTGSEPAIIEQEISEPSDTGREEVPEEQEEPDFIAIEYQLLPPQEQNYEAEFEKDFNKFKEAIYNKDLLALDGFLDEAIRVSFGGQSGKPDFYAEWELDQDPDQSGLWIELEKIIRLGGIYDAKTKIFIAPYVYADFPDEFDSFEHFAIIDKEVKAYETEDIGAGIIDELNYNIIKLNTFDSTFWQKTDYDFIKIETPSGRIGFIQKQFIRSPTGYRLSLKCNDNGEWKMTFLVAGD
jgi:hypothetical protein